MKYNILKWAFLGAAIITTANTFGQKKKGNQQQSVLWEVSGNGLAKPSYLFGTIHMICNEDYVHFAKLDSVYALATNVAVELDVTSPAVQMGMAQGLMATDGKKLSSYFTKEEFEALDAQLKPILGGVSLTMFDAFHPNILMPLIAKSFYPCDSVRSYDMELIQQIKKDNKKLTELDQVSVQVNAMKALPIEKVIEGLKQLASGKTDPAVGKELVDMIDAYKTEDLDKVAKLTSKSDLSKGELGEELLEKRNISWMPIIENMMKNDVSLVAFGAAHFVGKNGIIALLKDKGYTVKPIK